MAVHDYHFVTTWQLPSTCAEVYDVIGEPEALPRWWPSVYLEVTILEAGRADGLGKRVGLFTKGWLPYTLRWEFVVTEVDRPRRMALRATGDFDGTGIWTFAQRGEQVEVTYDWRIRANKPLLRALSPVLKPLFAANHRWAMDRGFESLVLELRRRQARSEADRRAIPPPPRPTFR